MAAQNTESWQSFFSDGSQGEADSWFAMRVLRRRGEPFLMVPLNPRLAAQALSLYPAQTSVARLAKSLMGTGLRLGLSIAGEKVSIPCTINHPFVQFLIGIAGTEGLPPFALLAGNPHAPGRRFVLMLFNRQNQPGIVVKAGKGPAAIRLIEQEDLFLRSVPQGTAGVPQLLSAFGVGNIHAIALPYLPGKPPIINDHADFEPLLTSWIDVNRLVRLGELHIWRKLELQPKSAGVNYAKLSSASLHPVVYHGDFAPWNIKVNQGVWQLLDWERGEPAGIPAWDWFHYIIQTNVLVRKLPVPDLVAKMEQMLGSSNFQGYASRAGIIGLERDLLLAYLHYSISVLQQTEELPRIQGLQAALTTKWPAIA